MTTIVLEARSVYGSVKLYPVGDAAQVNALRILTGKKTLDSSDVRALRALGLAVDVRGAALPEWVTDHMEA